jgi:predicted dienelactone hydrolase
LVGLLALLLVVALAGCAPLADTPHHAAPPAYGTTCAPTPRDLAAPGPYPAGALHTTLTSPPPQQNQRGQTQSTPTQRLDMIAWYPAASAQLHPPTDSHLQAMRDAPGARGCAFPVILFSDGYLSRPEDYATLAAHLASEGFIILAPQHDDRHDAFPFGILAQRSADLALATSQLTALNADAASPLRGMLDTRHIGLAGHSLGGLAVVLALKDSRSYQAVAAMAPAWLTDNAAFLSKLTTPLLVMAADHDLPLFVTGAQQLYDCLPTTTPHGLLTLRDADHGVFSDTCAQTPGACAIINRALSGFFLATLTGQRDALAALTPPPDATAVLQSTHLP